MSQYAHLSTPDPEFSAILTNTPAEFAWPPLDIDALRKFVQDFLRAGGDASFSETQLKVKEWKVPVKDGEIDIRTYVPQQNQGESKPLLVWIHGGGFVVGGLHTDDAMLQKLAVDTNISVVNVDYRLAPEFPFPTGLKDSYEALKWTCAHAQDLSADVAKGVLIGGGSAGGNMTAVLSHWARDDPILQGKVTGQILQIPAVVHMDVYPEQYKSELLSMDQNKDAPILTKAHMELFYEKYGITNPADPDVSPLLLPSHKGLPPAYLQLCGLDPLRDEGFLYERVLREQGVKTKFDVYPGFPHGFNAALPDLGETLKWDQDLRQAIKWLLGSTA